jgi:hypothetical protein
MLYRAAVETYFTFADRALRYDCAACRQRCCRGKGFAFGPDELVPLLARAPSLAPHVQLRAGGSFGAIDLTERCWFLASDGMCRIEVDHGRDAKPTTCRLFPFNRVFRLGAVRIVDVNSVLCPVEPADGAGQSHEALLEEMARLEGSPMLDTPPWQPLDLAPDWLERERAIADAAARETRSPDALAAAAGDADAGRHRAAWARVYGVEAAELDALEAQVAPRVALLYSSLRWNALFARGAPAYPQAVRDLPLRLRALTFLAALAARSLGEPPSLRGVTELLRAQTAVLDVLARFDAPVQLAEPKFDADVAPALQGALGALLAGAFRGGRTLGQLVESAASALPREARPLAVALAARQLDTLLPTLATSP